MGHLQDLLANTLIGHCESFVPAEKWLYLDYRFVVESFGYYPDLDESDCFLVTLNGLQTAEKFTRQMESDGQLPFLDVKVRRGETVITVYPNFTKNRLLPDCIFPSILLFLADT